jgi:hypothetical protein
MSIFDDPEPEAEETPEYEDNAGMEMPEDEDAVGEVFRSVGRRIQTAGIDIGGYDQPKQVFRAIDRKLAREQGLEVVQDAPPEKVEIGCGCGCGKIQDISGPGVNFQRFVEKDGLVLAEIDFPCGTRAAYDVEDIPEAARSRFLTDQEILETIEEEYGIPTKKRR